MAEKELVAELKKDWRGPLVRRFGLVEGPDASGQLRQAEKWLDKHADDPDLLLATARLCLRNELWGKAREEVLGVGPYLDDQTASALVLDYLDRLLEPGR